MRPAVAMLAAGSLFGSRLAAQAPGHSRAERIRSLSDSSQSYAVQLPPRYDAATRLPLLILMDPRGRAPIPLDCFSDAADRLGWILASSYDTRSDEPVDPNTTAVNAMLADLPGRLAVDPKRIYLAGFSGTARAAWPMAAELRGHVAGVVSVGAGLPSGPALLDQFRGDSTFGIAGGAGYYDFNFFELRALADTLQRRGLTSDLHRYRDGHSWPTATDCADALWWLELLAMRTGLARRDTALAGEGRSRTRREADSLRAAGQVLEAVNRLRGLVRVLDGWIDVGPERDVLAGWTATAEYHRRAEAEARALAEEVAWLGLAGRAIEQVREDGGAVTSRRFLEALQVDRLLREAADSGGSERALAAGRRVAWLFGQAAFYLPREYLAAGKPRTAAEFLAVAAALRPLGADACELARQTRTASGAPAAAPALRGCEPQDR
ncbi:MAG: hypothetical protein AB7S39_19395 [Gemmatimonadales bacterium]